MKITDPRTIALQAAARGWIGPAEVWDAACRWVLSGSRTDAKDLFHDTLDPEQLASLVPPAPASAETLGPTDPAESSMEEPSSEDLYAPSRNAPRYRNTELLGSGGVGLVHAALDSETGRVVALKTLKKGAVAEPRLVRQFLQEARVTAQLEHPNIVPIYDVGKLPDGQTFYTMRVVKRLSLHEVLSRPELRKHWPLGRLLGVFLDVTRALTYAHSRGVMHRDITPENILLGDFGEVYLADWGIAYVKDATKIEVGYGSAVNTSSQTRGTLGYIPPEVLKGESDKVDHRTDLFALGVVLYEILTGEHPFTGETGPQIVFATCEKQPRRPRDIVPGCPLVLEDLCLGLIAKEPHHRPESAALVAIEVEAFLEGAKERDRRRAEARILCERAKDPVMHFKALENERSRVSALAREVSKSIKAWEPPGRKRAVWSLEDRAAEAERDAGRALAEAIELYTKAIGYDAECAAAHRGLADLYWGRARAAEDERRPATQIYYEALVTEHDVDRTYAELLKADALLSLRSNPPGAHVTAQRYSERDRILVPGEERYLGSRRAATSSRSRAPATATCATPCCSRAAAATTAR
jgi:serine/threonine-protein kinase